MRDQRTWRVNHLIYAAGKDLHNTICTRIAMTEPIDADALREAADSAITRYRDCFAEILAEYGIRCAMDAPEHFEINDFVLPASV